MTQIQEIHFKIYIFIYLFIRDIISKHNVVLYIIIVLVKIELLKISLWPLESFIYSLYACIIYAVFM